MNSSDFRPGAVVFDLDGTLLDTFPAIVLAWNAGMAPLLGRAFEPAEVVAHFGLPDEQMLEAAFPASLARAEKDAALERYFGAYEDAHTKIKPFFGIESLLDSLVRRGVPLGVMTGKGRRACDVTLLHFGWANRFGSVVTGSEVREQKPHPEGVLRVARELGVSPHECVYVGDSPADIGAAKNAGMFAVVAGWHDFYFAQLQQLQPDLWPQSPLELQLWLEQQLPA